MSKPWPEVPLADIAKPISRTVAVLPGQVYRTIGVKWWGQGAYERETIDGSRTAAKTLSLVRQGDLIINKIWVRHGSTAIADADVDGCAAFGEFPTFTVDETPVSRSVGCTGRQRLAASGQSAMPYREARAERTVSNPSCFSRFACRCRSWRTSGEWWRGLRNWPPKSTRPAPSAKKSKATLAQCLPPHTVRLKRMHRENHWAMSPH
jgi:hypothetical protein